MVGAGTWRYDSSRFGRPVFIRILYGSTVCPVSTTIALSVFVFCHLRYTRNRYIGVMTCLCCLSNVQYTCLSSLLPFFSVIPINNTRHNSCKPLLFTLRTHQLPGIAILASYKSRLSMCAVETSCYGPRHPSCFFFSAFVSARSTTYLPTVLSSRSPRILRC